MGMGKLGNGKWEFTVASSTSIAIANRDHTKTVRVVSIFNRMTGKRKLK